METLLTYLLKVSLSLALFYGLHMVLLRTETFLRLRRAYFGVALLFSLFYPFISLSWTVAERTDLPFPAYILSEIVIVANPDVVGEVAEVSSSFSFNHLFIAALALGTMILLLRFLIQLASLIFKLREAEYSSSHNCKLLTVEDESTSSFSFFKWVVVNKSNANITQISDIVQHERAHAQQYHSIDVIAYELACILFWWNPFVWLLRNEMKLNLEYLADQEVQKDREDAREYQYTLLKISIANTGVAFINNFNVSQLKKRITMMNKKRTSKIWSSKFLLIFPLAIALVLGNVQCSDVDADKIDMTENAVDKPIDMAKIAKASVGANGVIVMEMEDGTVIKLDPKDIVDERDVPSNMKIIQSPQMSKDTPVFEVVETMPRFPGGEKEMMKFIKDNLKYPELAQKAGIQGRVVVRFIIDVDGSVVNTEILRGIEPDCDKEAVRVINAMPKWTPGKQNGKEVPVYFTLPIMFRLK